MTDPATTPETPAPEATAAVDATAPAAPVVPDVESIVSERLAAFTAKFEEERLKPLQREISERDEAIKKLKTASLSEDDREQLLAQEEADRIEAIETENWLLRKARENPAAADLFEKVLKADPDEQFALFVSLVSPATPTPEAAAPEADAQVPDIDKNNPAGASTLVPPGTPIMPDGTALTPEFRKNFLQNLPGWPTSR